MRGRIITSEHETWELPELLSWDLLRTGSVPCDSFEALCPYTAENFSILSIMKKTEKSFARQENFSATKRRGSFSMIS